MCCGAIEFACVGNGDGVIWAKYAIPLGHNDHWIHDINLFPDPVIVTVDVNTENSDVAGKAAIADQTVDVVTVNPRSDSGEVVSPVNIAATYPPYTPGYRL